MTDGEEPPPQPRPIPPCPDCGGRRVGGVRLITRSGSTERLALVPERNTWRAGPLLAGVVPFVCLECGNVKLYADDLTDLRKAAAEEAHWLTW